MNLDVILLHSNHLNIGQSFGHPKGLMGRKKTVKLRRWQRQRIPLKRWHLS